MIFLVATLAFAVVGLVVGRWWVLGLPVLFWVTWGVGMQHGWWGDGPGEALVRGTVGLSLLGTGAAAAGVGLHVALRALR